jgi:hypothetical protein
MKVQNPKEVFAMNRLTQIEDFKNTLDSMIDAFFHTFDRFYILPVIDLSWYVGLFGTAKFEYLSCYEHLF